MIRFSVMYQNEVIIVFPIYLEMYIKSILSKRKGQ